MTAHIHEAAFESVKSFCSLSAWRRETPNKPVQIVSLQLRFRFERCECGAERRRSTETNDTTQWNEKGGTLEDMRRL